MAYEKQTWVNGSTGGTPINADRLNHMEDGIYDSYKAIVTYGVDDASLQFTNTEGYQTFDISLNEVKSSYKNTNKFTLNTTTGKITIGEGVSKIKVSAQLAINRGDGNYLNIYILKNNVVIYKAGCYFGDWMIASPTLSPCLLDVQEGDVISLAFGVGAAATGKTFVVNDPQRTIHLTIEEV